MGTPFAVDQDDDLYNDCYDCKGKRLLERDPDKKFLRCFYCPYKEQIESKKGKSTNEHK